RIFSLAQICLDNGDFDVALKCYRYIIDNKEDGFYYSGSKMGLLNVMNKKITSGNYTSEELTMLEREYYTAIAEFGHSAEAVELTRDLALLQAYYLHKTDTAMALLRSAVIAGGIKPSLQARCKLALGDILLMRNEIWDASLLYSQVEKAYKYDPLGDEAKFRNAKVAFYTGDFHWAKAKLDVLKGSTSKLIANDAMYLSLLISDNTGIDTTERPLKMFARAELLAIQNKDQLSFRVLDSINELYPHHALEDDILLQRYKIAMKKREYERAKTFLEKLIGSYGYDILGDDATFLLAELYENKLNQPDKARELYLSLLTDYPGSLYVVQARKRFRKLRGDDPAALERDRRGGTMNDNP
ncbi:MAG: tol-pal system YbgF family protein, partial [Flavobacteriales bacterium]